MAMMQVSLRYSRDVVPVHSPVPEAYQICPDRKDAFRLVFYQWYYASICDFAAAFKVKQNVWGLLQGSFRAVALTVTLIAGEKPTARILLSLSDVPFHSASSLSSIPIGQKLGHALLTSCGVLMALTCACAGLVYVAQSTADPSGPIHW